MPPVRCARIPALRSPVAIFAFGGWGDAAEASTSALGTLQTEWTAQTFATVDPDDFYDYTQVRPRVYLDNQMMRQVEWPTGTFSFRRRPKAENDVVLFQAFEPQLRWQHYTSAILDFLEKLHVSRIVSLGSLLADAPHTRPVQLSGFATEPDLLASLEAAGIVMSRYEGPTGIVGALHHAAMTRGIPSLSIWGAAPHYIASATNPRVALAILEGLARTLDWSLDLGTLQQEAREFDAEVSAIIQANPEAAAYVARLEEALSQERRTMPPLPSGETLLNDLEEFLRRGREERGNPGARG